VGKSNDFKLIGYEATRATNEKGPLEIHPENGKIQLITSDIISSTQVNLRFCCS